MNGPQFGLKIQIKVSELKFTPMCFLWFVLQSCKIDTSRSTDWNNHIITLCTKYETKDFNFFWLVMCVWQPFYLNSIVQQVWKFPRVCTHFLKLPLNCKLSFIRLTLMLILHFQFFCYSRINGSKVFPTKF